MHATIGRHYICKREKKNENIFLSIFGTIFRTEQAPTDLMLSLDGAVRIHSATWPPLRPMAEQQLDMALLIDLYRLGFHNDEV